MSIDGWIASAALVLGWWWYPRFCGLALNTAGTVLWAYVAWKVEMWDLFTLDVILAAIQFRLIYRAIRVRFGLATAVFKNYCRS